MKNTNSSRPHIRRKKRRKGDTDQLAAQLAPLEEQNKPAAEHQIGTRLNIANAQADRQFGAIIVDNEDLKVPTDIIEAQEERYFLGMEPVVLVVLILMLSFIAFIAWQISLMPARSAVTP
ncbi:MAG TPA: hypothetical protein VJM12_21375 [Pyrinomonadaceae bacterium]|nr:hypothetical protein [Pyrinomonadaceae bacterium]